MGLILEHPGVIKGFNLINKKVDVEVESCVC